jgi:F0F1-type ATP synthase membrane subunit a
MNGEKKFKKYSSLFIIIILLLLFYIFVPNGTRLPPLQIVFEASPEGVGATINKPTGSEIVALVLILVFFTLWLYMYLKYKKETNTKSSKKK